ncbi:Uncharacterized zinc protease RF_0338 [Alphaproteobacteria bacterium]
MRQHYIKLNNGMQLIVDCIPHIESVSTKVLFKVGSRNEDHATEGISHCIEHMNFKGTTSRSTQQIAEEIDLVGGHINAYTSRERTIYYTKVLKDDFQLSVDILADITQNSIYDEEELRREKNVILQEIAESLDDPEDLVFDILQQQAFPGHQIGKPIAGTAESVMRIECNSILQYVNKYYTSNNTIIAVSGNVEQRKVIELVDRYFAKKSQKTIPQQNLNQSEQSNNTNNTIFEPKYGGGDVRVAKDIELIHVALAFNGISYYDENYYAQQVASIIIGGGMSSRLFQEIREKRGLAYNISSFLLIHKDCGLSGVYAATAPNTINELISVIIEQLHALTHSVKSEEVQRAKAQIKSSLLMEQESSTSRAEKIVVDYAIFGRFIDINEIIQKIDAIDEYVVQCRIKSMLDNAKVHNPTLSAVGNIKTMCSYDKVLCKL